MKRLLIIISIVVALAAGLVWASQGASDNGQVQGAASTGLTFATVQQDIKGSAKLYDVRTASEYAEGHFAGAVNWSLQDMQAGKLPSVAKDTKIYVYCHSGNRASQAEVLLKSAGYTNVTNLYGLTDVQAIGGTLVTD